MYYVLSKDKKKGTKLSHRLIIDILSKLYPKSIIEKHHNRFNGTYIICNLKHEKIYIKLNKTSHEFRPRKIHENISKNSLRDWFNESIHSIQYFDATFLCGIQINGINSSSPFCDHFQF